MGGHASANGDDSLQFSEGFLIGGRAIDMQRYVDGNPVQAGTYPLEVIINGQLHDKREIVFEETDGRQGAVLASLRVCCASWGSRKRCWLGWTRMMNVASILPASSMAPRSSSTKATCSFS